ncbi:MAG: DUF554 domain-containing protein [Fimbriimonadales bacterium]|nr:DUF554 domain-containing protein [Fimbriimonadales bacterium]
MRGTLFNTATVVCGALVGMAVGRFLPPATRDIAMGGLGLLSLALGVRMFLGGRRVLGTAAAIAGGGVLGHLLGIGAGLEAFSEFARRNLGGGGEFNRTVVTTTILYCVGPMTLLGCLRDGLEGDWELLGIKGMMDGIGAVFFAATMDPVGVLVTAGVLLVFQGSLTLMAKPLRAFLEDEEYGLEMAAAGGLMMVSIGLALLRVRELPTADYLPALALAPLFVWAGRRWARFQAGRRSV